MKRVLVHLGLPKTATTTLQHHLFQRLHDEGKINFLGKVVAYHENGKSYFKNYTGSVIRKACEQKITGNVARDIDELLVEDRLNVFSDEGIMVNYPGRVNLPLSQKINNLHSILLKYDVKVLMTIRQPVDYIFSLYIELYSNYYSSMRSINSFEKYAEQLLTSSSLMDQDSVYMHKNIDLVCGLFNAEILFFEDIKYDEKFFCQKVSELLDVDTSVVMNAISGNHSNIKRVAVDGVYSKRIFSFFEFKKKLAKKTRDIKLLHKVLRLLYHSKTLHLNRLDKLKIMESETLHKIPSPELRRKLCCMVGIPESFSADKYGLSKTKLQKYGYFAADSKVDGGFYDSPIL